MLPSRYRAFVLHHDGRLAEIAALTAGAFAGLPEGGWHALILRAVDVEPVGAECGAITRSLLAQRTDLGFLIPRRRPPSIAFRVDHAVESFALSPSALGVVLQACPGPAAATDAYTVFDALVAAPAIRSVAALQFPGPAGPPAATPTSPESWIIPHRGAAGYIATALRFVDAAATAGAHVHVGIDDEPGEGFAGVFRQHPQVRGCYCEPPGAGPYVIRNELIRQTSGEFALFQDSDDIPCVDRAPRLLAAVRERAADILGSHEVRVDDIERRIWAVRYPLDVNDALSRGAYQCQLHPTTLVRRASFLRLGGFSTGTRFAMDTQFLLRASFSLTIGNVDEFLYVRRIRKGSLTQDPGTGMRSLARVRVTRPWREDYLCVARGEKRLEASSLRLAQAATPWRLVPPP